MMIETGEIQKLWRDFHINLKTVRETTVCLPLLYSPIKSRVLIHDCRVEDEVPLASCTAEFLRNLDTMN